MLLLWEADSLVRSVLDASFRAEKIAINGRRVETC
jgi:hypothetical protein